MVNEISLSSALCEYADPMEKVIFKEMFIRTIEVEMVACS